MDAPDASQVDPALLELFRAEMDAHLPALSAGLLALEKGRADEGTIAGMMRAAHSIKGAARIVGFAAAVRVAHAMEDCFTAARDGHIRLGSAAVDVLLEGLDALQRVCVADPGATPDERALEALLARIADVRQGRAAEASRSAPAPRPDAAAARETRITLPADLDAPAAERLRAELCAGLSAGSTVIRLDFTAARAMSATGLAVLLSLAREVRGRGPELVVEGLAEPVAAVVRSSGLERAWSGGT